MEQLSPLEILSADKKVEQLSEEELHCVLKQLTDHSLPEREKCPLVRRLNAEDTAKNSDNSYPSTVASERTSASTPTSSSCSFASSSTTTSSRNCHNSHDEQEVMTTMCSSGNNSHVNNNHHHQGANNHHNHSHSSYSSHQQPQAYLQNLSSRLDKGLGGAFNSHAQNLQANSTSFVPQYYQSRTPANSTSTNHCDDSQSISNSRVKGRKGQQSLSSVGDVKMRKPPNRANSFTMPSTNQNISGDRDSSKSFSTSSPYIANMSNSSAKGDTGPLRLGSKNYSSGSPKMNGELANLSSGGGAAGRSGESQQHESHKPPHRKAQSVEVSSSAASPKALSSRSSPSNLVSNSSHSQSDITPSLTSTNSTTSSSTGRPPFTAYNLSEVKKGNISTTSAQEASAEGREAGAKILSTFSNNISSSGDNPLSQLSNFVHKYHQSEAPTEGGISSRMLSSEDGEQKSHRISYKGLAPKSGHCYLRKHRSLSLAEEDEEESCDKSASSLCFGEEMNLQSQGQLMEYHSHQSKSKSPSRSKVKEHVDKCLEMSLFSSNSGGANNSYSNTLEENHYNNYQALSSVKNSSNSGSAGSQSMLTLPNSTYYSQASGLKGLNTDVSTYSSNGLNRPLKKKKKPKKNLKEKVTLAQDTDGFVGFIEDVDMLEKFVNNKVDPKELGTMKANGQMMAISPDPNGQQPSGSSQVSKKSNKPKENKESKNNNRQDKNNNNKLGAGGKNDKASGNNNKASGEPKNTNSSTDATDEEEDNEDSEEEVAAVPSTTAAKANKKKDEGEEEIAPPLMAPPYRLKKSNSLLPAKTPPTPPGEKADGGSGDVHITVSDSEMPDGTSGGGSGWDTPKIKKKKKPYVQPTRGGSAGSGSVVSGANAVNSRSSNYHGGPHGGPGYHPHQRASGGNNFASNATSSNASHNLARGYESEREYSLLSGGSFVSQSFSSSMHAINSRATSSAGGHAGAANKKALEAQVDLLDSADFLPLAPPSEGPSAESDRDGPKMPSYADIAKSLSGGSSANSNSSHNTSKSSATSDSAVNTSESSAPATTSSSSTNEGEGSETADANNSNSTAITTSSEENVVLSSFESVVIPEASESAASKPSSVPETVIEVVVVETTAAPSVILPPISFGDSGESSFAEEDQPEEEVQSHEPQPQPAPHQLYQLRQMPVQQQAPYSQQLVVVPGQTLMMSNSYDQAGYNGHHNNGRHNNYIYYQQAPQQQPLLPLPLPLAQQPLLPPPQPTQPPPPPPQANNTLVFGFFDESELSMLNQTDYCPLDVGTTVTVTVSSASAPPAPPSTLPSTPIGGDVPVAVPEVALSVQPTLSPVPAAVASSPKAVEKVAPQKAASVAVEKQSAGTVKAQTANKKSKSTKEEVSVISKVDDSTVSDVDVTSKEKEVLTTAPTTSTKPFVSCVDKLSNFRFFDNVDSKSYNYTQIVDYIYKTWSLASPQSATI